MNKQILEQCLEPWNRRASWILAFLALLLIAFLIKTLMQSRANERAADVQVARLSLQVSALKLAATMHARTITPGEPKEDK